MQPQGKFLSDSAGIGEEIPFSLSIRYPKNLQIIFPDSLYDFSPFEFSRKQYFTTRSDTAQSLDSTIYYLTTFEIEDYQSLSLPVYILTQGDSTEIISNTDSIKFSALIAQLPDSLALKENTNYQKVKRQFNYPYWLIGLAILLILALAVIFLFGEKIKRNFQLRRLRKAHERFLAQYASNTSQLKSNPNIETGENTLKLWKGYMEKLEGVAYTKLTSKEILKIHADEGLRENLRGIDRSLYSGEMSGELDQHFDNLLNFSVESYNRKIEKIEK